MELQDDQMDKHKKLETIDEKIGHKLARKHQVRQTVRRLLCKKIDMLGKFQQMWDKRLGQIDMAKHCIQTTLQNVHHFNSALQTGGPELQEF